MKQDLDLFLRAFESATKSITSKYMQLPVAGAENPIYRERVYCYELYHCLRKEMGDLDNFQYFLCGEVDKSGHPLIRGNILDKSKPDFLVHKPGHMDKNLVVIEVKPINTTPSAIVKDLRCLTAFRRQANYFHSIYLIYGEEQNKFARIKERAHSLETRSGGEIDLSLISLYSHRAANCFAERHSWGS